MKALSFSALEILPALLNKSKTQTIRPAWRLLSKKSAEKQGKVRWNLINPRFQVGDLCQLMWHQRTSPKGSEFCSICGKIFAGGVGTTGLKNLVACMNQHHLVKPAFPKILGTVRITEVFQIEMRKDTIGFYAEMVHGSGYKWRGLTPKLWKKDGFKSAEEMFNWFDKKYDLKSPKRFWVYRWGFNEEKA